MLYFFITLSEGSSAVNEMIVENNLNESQSFSWKLDTGIESITPTSVINISTDNVFIFIEANYTIEGVYKTIALINSTNYNDTQDGVVVS